MRWIGVVAVIAVLAVLFFGFTIGSRMIRYNVEFWILKITHKEVDVNFWLCGVAGVFVGWNIAIPCTLVTWIVSMATTEEATQ